MSTIISVVAIAVAIIAITLFVYFVKKKKDKQQIGKRKYVMLAAFLFCYLCIPFVLNVAFEGNWYSFMKIPSSFTEKEWFGFLASYVGNIGTIVFGWIAFWQTEIINKQSEFLMQYQKVPVVGFQGVSVEFYRNPPKLESKRNRVENILFKQYGCRKEITSDSFLIVGVDFNPQGLIPVTECVVQKTEWIIKGQTIELELNEEYKTIGMADHLDIVFDNQQLNQEITHFVNCFAYNQRGLAGYDKCEVILHMTFKNEAAFVQNYKVWCRFNAEDVDEGKIEGLHPCVNKVKENANE